MVLEEEATFRKIFNLSSKDRVVFDDGGWTSRIYLFDQGRYVIKFPRKESVKTEYYYEAKTYDLLKSQTILATPRLVELGKNASYLAYEGVQGVNFESYGKADESLYQKMGWKLGEFLSWLHSQKVENYPEQNLDELQSELVHKFNLVKSVVSNRLSNEQMKKLENFVLDGYVSELSRFIQESVFCHGDLGPWNLVIQEREEIGVIDFGDSGFYDRSVDFSSLNNAAILGACLDSYGSDPVLERAVSLRCLMLPVVELPYYHGKGRMKEFELNLYKIEQNMIDYPEYFQ